jgi:hypothetical protein
MELRSHTIIFHKSKQFQAELKTLFSIAEIYSSRDKLLLLLLFHFSAELFT